MRTTICELLRKRNVTQENDAQLRHLSVGELIARAARKDEAIAEIAWENVLEFEREGMAKATVEEDATTVLKVLLDRKFQLAI